MEPNCRYFFLNRFEEKLKSLRPPPPCSNGNGKWFAHQQHCWQLPIVPSCESTALNVAGCCCLSSTMLQLQRPPTQPNININIKQHQLNWTQNPKAAQREKKVCYCFNVGWNKKKIWWKRKNRVNNRWCVTHSSSLPRTLFLRFVLFLALFSSFVLCFLYDYIFPLKFIDFCWPGKHILDWATQPYSQHARPASILVRSIKCPGATYPVWVGMLEMLVML